MIYLDNCATTKPRNQVVKVMIEALEMDFGNPSSLHRLGMSSEKKIKEARRTIAQFLKVDERELIFTSGGTESNNIALQSIINKFTITDWNYIIIILSLFVVIITKTI